MILYLQRWLGLKWHPVQSFRFCDFGSISGALHCLRVYTWRSMSSGGFRRYQNKEHTWTMGVTRFCI